MLFIAYDFLELMRLLALYPTGFDDLLIVVQNYVRVHFVPKPLISMLIFINKAI